MEHRSQPGITVFTPTYNRAALLGRLYESLKSQSCPQLEWLVVDDGSTDDTKQVMDGFISEGLLDIRYIYKENGGKHTAMNMGIREASREYFLCIDSDDLLMHGAFARLLEVIKDRPAGIIAYKQNLATGQRIGDPFPEELRETTLIALNEIFRCGGDRTLVYRTELLRRYPIPELPGQRFFPEAWLYDRIDEAHKSLLLPEVLCSCEYQPGGYSDAYRQLILRNSLSMKQLFADRIDMALPFRLRFDAAYHYIAFSLLCRSKLAKYPGKQWWLLTIAAPLGLTLALWHWLHKK